jgi:hypothetical protein
VGGRSFATIVSANENGAVWFERDVHIAQPPEVSDMERLEYHWRRGLIKFGSQQRVNFSAAFFAHSDYLCRGRLNVSPGNFFVAERQIMRPVASQKRFSSATLSVSFFGWGDPVHELIWGETIKARSQ